MRGVLKLNSNHPDQFKELYFFFQKCQCPTLGSWDSLVIMTLCVQYVRCQTVHPKGGTPGYALVSKSLSGTSSRIQPIIWGMAFCTNSYNLDLITDNATDINLWIRLPSPPAHTKMTKSLLFRGQVKGE
ncbi:hypothetical protein I7I50_12090 [Histoplasma capsulatum G186AR]|uniref:Uncharacterized protein n=1 Tax=Ajellomyces capsulatus TaxID=5037 RepID=A0A8H8CR76_AJECA|nr:hypothetical protein I7I52_11598 [Histoplasma capsulatum]QSS70455.1 hypothetical protein I7I50_12090 [Histoplasma capsulatum G186AR]